MKLAARYRLFLMPLVIALWAAFLFLPFKGPRAAGLLFITLAAAIPVLKVVWRLAGRLQPAVEKLKQYIPGDSRFLLLLFLPAAVLPLISADYIIDVAIISGIYIILALGLNVVVGLRVC